jgi:hypothetical protein
MASADPIDAEKKEMKGNRYCGMCDRMVVGRECPFCGADTDAMPRTHHTCHDMNPPFPGPCAACAEDRAANRLWDALRKSVPK